MTIKDSNSIDLIETFIHKEEQKARLITIHELATKLLKKQETATASKAKPPKAGHAVYEHLRPMYRTVHRTKPREMVLRAIRWVNPERMFPIMSWNDKKLDSLSLEEFEEAFVELAKIRREAHVISNRYDQMMNAIDAGQVPYHIPYAGINYMSLEEHRERATRLGAGAEDWGWEIDQKAENFRQKFENKDWRDERQKKVDKSKPLMLTVDSIDGLWEDGAPPFMRTREGKKGERLMRARRQSVTKFQLDVQITDGDGNDLDIMEFTVHAEDEKSAVARVQGAAKRAGGSNVAKVDVVKIEKGDKVRMPTMAKVWAQEFVAVPELERRPGEEIRLPAGNLKGTLRIPAEQPSWMSDTAWKNLQQKRKGMFGPKGKKIDLTVRPLDFYDTHVEIALRREERWTQRGLAPHRGAASQAAGGHGEEEGVAPPRATPTRRRPQETSEEREAREEARRQRAEQARKEAEGPTAGHTKGTALLKNQRVEKRISDVVPQINDFILIDAPDFDIETHFLDDNIEKTTLASGGVLNRGSTFVATDNDGQRWLIKATGEVRNKDENLKELAVSALDRALGLNLCPRIMLANNVQAKVWTSAAGENASSVRRMFEGGQGHIGEWINDDSKMVDQLTFEELQGTIATPEQRARWYGIALLDAISGNWDSWGNNLMFKPGVGVFSIDNGLSFGTSKIENTAVFKGSSGFGDSFAPGQGHGMGNTSGILRSAFAEEGFDRNEITQELDEWFNQTWEPDAIQAAMEAFGINPPAGGWDTLQNSAKLQKEFTDKMTDWMFDRGGNWATWKANGIPTHRGR